MSLDLSLAEDCIEKFDLMKMKSAYKFIIYSIKNEKEVIN